MTSDRGRVARASPRTAATARVAIVSDTHGALDERIAREVRKCDYCVHAGDLGSAEVFERLQPRAGQCVVVRGNNDVESKWPRADRAFLRTLPVEARLELPGGELVVVHGDAAGRAARRHQWLRERYPHARVIVYGHSHRLHVDTRARPWVVNPGAAGRARTFGGPSLVVLSAALERWRLRSKRFPPAKG